MTPALGKITSGHSLVYRKWVAVAVGDSWYLVDTYPARQHYLSSSSRRQSGRVGAEPRLTPNDADRGKTRWLIRLKHAGRKFIFGMKSYENDKKNLRRVANA